MLSKSLSLTVMAGLLIACGGGGGGGAPSGPDNAELVDPNVTLNSDGSFRKATFRRDGQNVTIDGASERFVETSSNIDLFAYDVYVDGFYLPDATAYLLGYTDSGALFGLATTDEGAVGYAGTSTQFYDDRADLRGVSGSTTLRNIDYGFGVLEEDGTFYGREGNNGRITINGGNAIGTFGDVTVEGRLNGRELIGTSRLAGYGAPVPGYAEGQIVQFPTGEIDTIGAFAGGNADLAYSGGWAGYNVSN